MSKRTLLIKKLIMNTIFKTCITLLAILAGNIAFGQSLYEEFTLGNVQPVGWTQTSVSPNDVWRFGGALDFGASSLINDPDGNLGQYARMDFSIDPDTTALVTPARSIAGIPNPEFSFYYISQTNNTSFTPYNRLVVQYWTGGAWANVAIIDTLTTSGWVKYTYNAALFTYSTDSVRFRFAAQEGGFAVGGTGTTTFDQDMAIDNVLIGALCNPTTGTDVQSACGSYTWIDGMTYTSSNNTATHTLTNAGGCDSVITLNLTINNSTASVDTQIACDSFTWINGMTYTSSNSTATDTLMNAAGCDSIITLNLTINNSTTGIDTQIACDSFTWIDGNTYTSSNTTATHTLMNAAGCDSIVTLNLTINPIMTNATVNNVLCNGDSTGTAMISTTGGNGTVVIDWGGLNSNILPAGTFTYTATDSNNCVVTDSVVISEPAALSISIDSVTNVTCNGASDGATLITVTGGMLPYTYAWSNADTTLNLTGVIPGTYTNTITDANGCTISSSAITITEPTAIIGTAIDNSNGSATASATGGTAAGNYTFLWDSNAGNQTTATATGLSVGTTYCVTITDDNNCSDTACVNIVTSIETLNNTPNAFKVYPNPTTGYVFVDVITESSDDVQLAIYNTTGQQVQSVQFPSQSTRFELNMTELPTGVYILRFAVDNKITTKKLILQR